MLAGTDNVAEAKVAYSQAIVILDELKSQADLRATVQSNLAGMLARDKPAVALELARESLTQQLTRLEADSGDPELATQVIVTLNTLAKAQSESSDHKAAAQTLRQAVEIGRQVNARWPEQLPYRRDLVVSLNSLGTSLSELKRLDQAGIVLEQAAKHGRYLDTKLPNSAEIQSMLGGVLNNLGFVRHQQGDEANALQCYGEAVDRQQAAARLAPDVPRYRQLLETHQFNLDRLEGDS